MLEKGVQYSASDFIALKARVKAEMLRRCHTGSVAEYGGANYDFTINPNSGGQLLIDQINKIIVPMNAVNNTGVSQKKVGDQAMALNALVAKITQYEAAPFEGESHGCNASCTGLCHTECSTGCTGECTETCGGNCTTSCTGTCQGTCSETCSGSCGTTCGDGCSGGCGNSCQGSCSGTCYWGCTGSNDEPA